MTPPFSVALPGPRSRLYIRIYSPPSPPPSTGGAVVAMTHREALEVLAAHRGSHLVITTHGSIDLWKSLSDTPLDFAYVPISMGQGPALGLGLALAQSRHGVV